MANKTHLRLSDIRSVKRVLGKLANQLYRGEINGALARDMGYLLKIFIECVEKGDFEARIEALEAATKKLGDNKK